MKSRHVHFAHDRNRDRKRAGVAFLGTPRWRSGLVMNADVRAFTLAELIVAVAAVALLTVGIGQIFSSVGRLTGAGAALAESDQLARALSQQLSDDFDALNTMRPEDTFLAIRCRRLGDLDRDGALDADERAMYVTREDRDADQREQVLPYSQGSRAVTVRADEIMFLGLTGGYSTMQVSRNRPLEPTPSSPVARIYYGHGLRPQPDPLFDPRNPPPTSNVPQRQWVPDGDFGDRAGQINARFNPSMGAALVAGRNEFAGELLLLRQTLLLFGGTAAGYASTNKSPFDTGLFYTPFIREQESILRKASLPPPGGDIESLNPGFWPRYPNFADPRLISRGRVDICAQSEQDVKRWLEGADPVGTAHPQDASAFSDGLGDKNPLDLFLWTRRTTPLAAFANTLQNNAFYAQKAIAGCFTRIQAEDQPPPVDRADSSVSNTGAIADFTARDAAWTSLMDTHASLGPRCSSFEVAWSDGTTWNQDAPLDLDDDGRPEYQRGDVVWFDINLARYSRPEDVDTPPGSTTNNTSLASINQKQYPNWNDAGMSPNPEFRRGAAANLLRTVGPNLYNKDFTIGSAFPDGEYLAIWGFRMPDDTGGYSGEAWPKPRMIRIRLTLHDAQFRIPGGRTYEFVYGIGN